MENLPDILKNYVGNKAFQGMAERLINEIPPHVRYFEPFAGSAALFRTKKVAKMNVLVDKDVKVSEALRDYFGRRNGTVVIVQRDSVECWGALFWNLCDTDFLYLDPPYPIEYRYSGRKLYGCEMSNAQHVELLERVKRTRAMVMISTNPNPIYEAALSDWRKLEIRVSYQGRPAVEVVYMNYPQPTELHEYTFLGRDALDRQRIRRKLDRRMESLARLPALERAALIERLKEIL